MSRSINGRSSLAFGNVVMNRLTRQLFVNGTEVMLTAKELLGSQLKPGTANNEINAIREDGLSFMVSHYVTDTNGWYLLGDQHDLNFIWDQKPRGGMEEDLDQEVIKRKVVQGYVAGHGEFRGTWGTSGAT